MPSPLRWTEGRRSTTSAADWCASALARGEGGEAVGERRAGDAFLGHDGGDERGGRHVERPVLDGNAGRRHPYAAHRRHLVPRPALHGNGRAVGTPHING